MAHGIQVGDKAPDFTLPAQSGEPVRLQDRLGERVVVLYFYPKDTRSRLHRRGVRLPRQPRGLHRRRRRGDRGQLRLGRQARRVRRPAQTAIHAAQRPGRSSPQTLRGTGGTRLATWPGHVRDRPPGHGPARLQLHDQHRPARERRAGGGPAVAGRTARLTAPAPVAVARRGPPIIDDELGLPPMRCWRSRAVAGPGTRHHVRAGCQR
jgi:hypothetical protein